MIALCVDDAPDGRAACATFLRRAGVVVLEASDADSALRMAFAVKPDVILLDLGLPDIDGFETVRRLRTDPRTSHARVLAVTGYSSREDIEAARAAGFDGFLVKPLDFASLRASLEPVLATAAAMAGLLVGPA